MAKAWSIDLLGDKALSKKFDKLRRGAQGKVLRPAMRDSAKRAKARVVQNLSGEPVGVVTGQTLEAFKRAPIRSVPRDRDEIRIGMVLPTREELGIDKNDKWYYPFALEYGHPRAEARPFIRPAIDNFKEQERAIIARKVAAGMIAMVKV